MDVVAARVRQGAPDHEGEVVSGKPVARRRAHTTARSSPLAFQGGSRGTVAAVPGPALAPLADGLGADAAAPGRLAAGLGGAGDPGPHGRGGAGAGTDREHRAVPPARGARSRPSKRHAHAPIARRAWSR